MNIIDVEVRTNRNVVPNKIYLGNKYEKGVTYLNIILDEEIKNKNTYLYLKNDIYNKFLIYPVIDLFNITQKISKFDGTWYIHIIITEKELEDIETITNEEELFDNDIVFVSNVLCGNIKNVKFDLNEDISEEDENLKLLYDDLLNLKKELENIISKEASGPPIGSIILLTVDINPAEYFSNTTWERFAPGLNLRGVDINSDFYNVPEKVSGGEPIILETVTSNEAIVIEDNSINVEYLTNNKIKTTYNTYSPNITVYMWKRIS